MRRYYEIAPRIVAAIPDEHADWAWISDRVDDAVVAIAAGKDDRAFGIYVDMVRRLEERWLEAPAARRVRMLFEEAAAARASDVVFENDSGLCRVHGIVNDRKLQLADPLPADEGREVMGFLFHCKDEGSAQTSYQRSAFQGFSIRAGGQVPLPATVSALRCQRGPHEPDGDHLFARLFYRDRIERGTTLESLGFSPELGP